MSYREIFSKPYEIKLKSDCIYHFPTDLEHQTDTVHLLFQINRKMVNTIRFRFDLIRFLCAHVIKSYWKDNTDST